MEEIVLETEEKLKNSELENKAPVFDVSKLDKKSLEILEETEEDDYKFKIDQFEGPLDLLLHLIKLTKIDICDIFLSDITEQYLEMMKDIEDVDVEKFGAGVSTTDLIYESSIIKILFSKELDKVLNESVIEQSVLTQIKENNTIYPKVQLVRLVDSINALNIFYLYFPCYFCSFPYHCRKNPY